MEESPPETTRSVALRLIDFLKQKVIELDTARDAAEEKVRSLMKEILELKSKTS